MPAGLEVSLQALDQSTPVAQYSCILQADQTCTVDKVALAAQRIYVAWADYQDQRFFSNVLDASAMSTGKQTELPLLIYETTTDASKLTADRLHVFFQFPEAGTLRVSELYLITNPTNQVALLQFKLPEGASNPQLENVTPGDRYIASLTGPSDSAPLLPGPDPNQILVVYTLPYERKLPLSLEVPLSVQTVMVMLPSADAIHLSSSQLQAMGQQSVQGTEVQLYSTTNVSAGQAVQMTLSGNPSTAPQVNRGTVGGLLFGGAAFLGVVGVSGLWLYNRRKAARSKAADTEVATAPLPSMEELLDAIVTLDDLHRSGQLPEDAYQERRAELKEKLRQRTESRE